MRLQRCDYYYTGAVLQEKVDVELTNDQDVPLLFPVGLNVVKLLCLAQADTIFGEWEELPVHFGVRQDDEIDDADLAAINLAHSILENSDAGTLLWEHELDRNVYGGGVIKISPTLARYPYIQWSRVPRDGFYPVWNPEDLNDLLECYVQVNMTAEQAKERYGYNTDKDVVSRVEHWTKFRYTNHLDGMLISDLSGVNPWGIVPFIYTPRLRFNNWFGESLAEDIIPIQDELNMRVADIGDAINYNAHPTRWGLNLPRDFNAGNYPLGPNSFWNLGRSLGSSPEPKVGLLEVSAAVQPGVFNFLNFVYDWARTSSFAPPIAFGEDDGGGQRSGITLEIRMWPLLKAVRRSRSYLAASLRRAMHISGLMLRQKEYPGIPARATKELVDGSILPRFYNIMPRDQQQAVDEVTKLLSTEPKAISLETAQSVLGRGSGEVNRIIQMNETDELWTNATKEKELELQQETAEKALEAKSMQAKQAQEDKKAEPEKDAV